MYIGVIFKNKKNRSSCVGEFDHFVKHVECGKNVSLYEGDFFMLKF